MVGMFSLLPMNAHFYIFRSSADQSVHPVETGNLFVQV